MPAADVDAGHRLQRLEARAVVRRLGIAVDVVARRRHQGVVHVAGVVPDTVFLHHLHMAHLHGQEVFDHRLPHAAVIHVGSDPEDGRRARAVAQPVEPLFADLGEIHLQVVVAQELTLPARGRERLHDAFAVSVVAHQRRFRERRLAPVGLDDRDLALGGQIAHLRGLHDRRAGPAGHDVRLDIPLHGALGHAGGELRAEDEPAVVVVHPAVIELELGVRQAPDGQPRVGIVRTEGEAFADGIRRRDDRVRRVRAVALADQVLHVGARRPGRLEVADALIDIALLREQRRIRLLREDALPVVHQPGLAEEVAREEFEVEARAARQHLGHRPVQVDRDQEALAGRLQRDGVRQLHVRVDHGVEARHVAGRIRKAERRGDALPLDLAAKLFRDRLPLAGRGLETDVAVARHAAPVHQHGDAALVSFGVKIIESHHVHAVAGVGAGLDEPDGHAQLLVVEFGDQRLGGLGRAHRAVFEIELSHWHFSPPDAPARAPSAAPAPPCCGRLAEQ